MISDVVWWAGAGIGVVLVLLARLSWRKWRARPYSRGRAVHTGSGDAQAAVGWREIRSLHDTLDRQAKQVQELRTRFDQRATALEQRVDTMERAARARPADDGRSHPALPPERRAYAGGYGTDATGHEAPAGLARRPGAGDLPVEVRDGAVVASDALPPVAFVVPDGPGRGRVFLNPEVQLNEFALPKWEEFFELGRRQPYAAYRTVRPAEVSWDSAAGRGTLVTRGMAEAL